MAVIHKTLTLVISDGRDCVHLNADVLLRHVEVIDDNDISKDVAYWTCTDTAERFTGKHEHMHGAVLNWFAKRLYVEGED